MRLDGRSSFHNVLLLATPNKAVVQGAAGDEILNGRVIRARRLIIGKFGRYHAPFLQLAVTIEPRPKSANATQNRMSQQQPNIVRSM